MTMRKLPPIPKFESEADEAQWWFDHRNKVSEDLLAAAKSGTLGEGSAARAARKQKEALKQDSAA